jgi:hypothetical protein
LKRILRGVLVAENSSTGPEHHRPMTFRQRPERLLRRLALPIGESLEQLPVCQADDASDMKERVNQMSVSPFALRIHGSGPRGESAFSFQ